MPENKEAAEQPQFTDQDRDRLNAKAKKLVEKNERVKKAFFSMAAAIRLYNVALAAINDECIVEKLGEDSEMVTAVLRESIKVITSKPFERGELSSHIQQHVLEFMAMELSLEQELEAKTFRSEEEARQGVRREQPVALGHALITKDGYFGMGRDRTLLLVGDGDVLKELTDAAMLLASANRQTGVCLLAAMKTNTDATKSGNTNQWRFDLGQQHWINFAATRRKVTELLNRMLHRLRGNRLDLLVVEDLNQALDAGGATPMHIRANAAQRTIRQYADQAGAAVICCLPTQDANPADSDWDKLEVYTDLRFVSKDSNDVIEIANRNGESWQAIPQADKDPFDDQSNDEHCGGLPLQAEGGCEESDQLGSADASQDHEEAGDD